MKDKITNGEKYGPAMKITDIKKADAYFEELVQHNMKNTNNNRKEAEQIERSNLGYYSGYYDNETIERVQRLFSCRHPIFGSAENIKTMSSKQSFEAGKEAGKKRNT